MIVAQETERKGSIRELLEDNNRRTESSYVL